MPLRRFPAPIPNAPFMNSLGAAASWLRSLRFAGDNFEVAATAAEARHAYDQIVGKTSRAVSEPPRRKQTRHRRRQKIVKILAALHLCVREKLHGAPGIELLLVGRLIPAHDSRNQQRTDGTGQPVTARVERIE